jgi:hypothetical protein
VARSPSSQFFGRVLAVPGHEMSGNIVRVITVRDSP